MSLRFSSPFDDPGASLHDRLAALSTQELALLEWRMRWKKQGRPKQHPPAWAWDTWGIMSGRGFGKTLTGSHWGSILACLNPGTFGAVIAPTLDDARYTNFEGPTGIVTITPPGLITDYNKSDLILYYWNGSMIRGFGSEKPDRLRGPQHHWVWGDEVAAWEYAEDTWDMMEFGLRLGDEPQIMWTTTPKPLPIVKMLVAQCARDPQRHVLVTGSTDENRENLTKRFYERVARYRGTKIGRQELEGELIDLEESGIVQRSQFRLWPYDDPLPHFVHIVLSLDSAYTEKTFDPRRKEPDPSACVIFGLFDIKEVYHVMILDVWRRWLGLPDLIKRVKHEFNKTWGQIDVPLLQKTVIPSRWTGNAVASGKGIDVLLIEDKGSGISLRQSLSMENIFMEPYNPGRADKLARMHAITPMVAHGRVWVPESGKRPGHIVDWLETEYEDENPEFDPDRAQPGFIPEVCTFHGPGTTTHDDYVDAFSQGLRYFMHKFVLTFVTGYSEEERLQMLQEDEKIRAEHGRHYNPYAA